MSRCFICGKVGRTERHHIFGGAMRKKSEEYKLVVDLCHNCHNEPPYGVHHCKELMDELHKWGQKKAMQENGWTVEDFRREFYKNYLEDGDYVQ